MVLDRVEFFKLDMSNDKKQAKVAPGKYEYIPRFLQPTAYEMVNMDDPIQLAISTIATYNRLREVNPNCIVYLDTVLGQPILRIWLRDFKTEEAFKKTQLGKQIRYRDNWGGRDARVEINSFYYRDIYNENKKIDIGFFGGFIDVFKNHMPNCVSFEFSGDAMGLVVYAGTNYKEHLAEIEKTRVTHDALKANQKAALDIAKSRGHLYDQQRKAEERAKAAELGLVYENKPRSEMEERIISLPDQSVISTLREDVRRAYLEAGGSPKVLESMDRLRAKQLAARSARADK